MPSLSTFAAASPAVAKMLYIRTLGYPDKAGGVVRQVDHGGRLSRPELELKGGAQNRGRTTYVDT
jgi:hypothetical protein